MKKLKCIILTLIAMVVFVFPAFSHEKDKLLMQAFSHIGTEDFIKVQINTGNLLHSSYSNIKLSDIGYVKNIGTLEIPDFKVFTLENTIPNKVTALWMDLDNDRLFTLYPVSSDGSFFWEAAHHKPSDGSEFNDLLQYTKDGKLLLIDINGRQVISDSKNKYSSRNSIEYSNNYNNSSSQNQSTVSSYLDGIHIYLSYVFNGTGTITCKNNSQYTVEFEDYAILGAISAHTSGFLKAGNNGMIVGPGQSKSDYYTTGGDTPFGDRETARCQVQISLYDRNNRLVKSMTVAFTCKGIYAASN